MGLTGACSLITGSRLNLCHTLKTEVAAGIWSKQALRKDLAADATCRVCGLAELGLLRGKSFNFSHNRSDFIIDVRDDVRDAK